MLFSVCLAQMFLEILFLLLLQILLIMFSSSVLKYLSTCFPCSNGSHSLHLKHFSNISQTLLREFSNISQIYINFAQLYLLTAVPVFALPQITQTSHPVMAVWQVFIQLLEPAIPPNVCLSVICVSVCLSQKFKSSCCGGEQHQPDWPLRGEVRG